MRKTQRLYALLRRYRISFSPIYSLVPAKKTHFAPGLSGHEANDYGHSTHCRERRSGLWSLVAVSLALAAILVRTREPALAGFFGPEGGGSPPVTLSLPTLGLLVGGGTLIGALVGFSWGRAYYGEYTSRRREPNISEEPFYQEFTDDGASPATAPDEKLRATVNWLDRCSEASRRLSESQRGRLGELP